MPELALSPYQQGKESQVESCPIFHRHKTFFHALAHIDLSNFLFLFGYVLIFTFSRSLLLMCMTSNVGHLSPAVSASVRELLEMQTLFLGKVFVHFCPRFISRVCPAALICPLQCSGRYSLSSSMPWMF